jgi:antitoxin (DNA-binding transcriptional repressor) of toxin-antitoxin stability system
MITKLIGVKEFRQNVTSLYKKAKENNINYVVLNRNQPIFKVSPLSKKDTIIEKLALDIEEARNDVKNDRVYDFEDVCNELGL